MQPMQSSLLPKNDTKSTSSSKFDCAKECPCGVPVIPVPDQWLEVMVTGGFKVWHIIFIIIAFVVTIIVVYCCFHRCRIPRTKQEIEADLMRTNITNKFRDYLQEFPNEPTTFIEALKKVQELEEKSELDDAQYARDAGARKRKGWLKLKGKGGGGDKPATEGSAKEGELAEEGGETAAPAATDGASQEPNGLPPDPLLASSEQLGSKLAIVEPTAVVVDPSPSDETVPKAVEAAAAAEGDEGAEPKAPKPHRRKKQNLSRTKRAKALDIEKPAEQVAIKMTENVRSKQRTSSHHHHHKHHHRVKIDESQASSIKEARAASPSEHERHPRQ